MAKSLQVLLQFSNRAAQLQRMLIARQAVVMSRTLEANVHRLILLSNDALLALELVAQRADPVNRVGRLVVSLINVATNLESFIASAGFEVLDVVWKTRTEILLEVRNKTSGWSQSGSRKDLN